MVHDSESGESIDSLSRGLEVLRLFSTEEVALGVNDVAGRLAITKPMAYRILETLTAQHFLTRLNGADRYLPDVASLAIGRSYLDSISLMAIASQPLQDLAQAFHMTAILAGRERLNMICLALQSFSQEKEFKYGVGDIVPIASTAMGCAWLWAQETVLQAEIIDRLKQADNRSKKSVGKLYGGFQQLEDTGYCTFKGDSNDGAVSIATPLVLTSSMVLALCCKTTSNQHNDDSILANEVGQRLKEVATELAVQNRRLR